MEALRKAYILFVAIALLVLVIARPPLEWLGLLALAVTLVSLVGMVGYATGVRSFASPFWLGWLGLQVVVEFAYFYVGSDALWNTIGWDWGLFATTGLGVIMLPLYVSLYRLGRGRVIP